MPTQKTGQKTAQNIAQNIAPHVSDIGPLLAQLNISPSDVRQDLLRLALVDISSSATENNEKLEFLGDAALRLAAAEFLMETYPQMALGEMSAVRSQIVSDRILATLAKKYSLSRYIIMSRSAAGDKAGTNSRLADTFEALLGSLYLSTGDLRLIRPWLDPHFAQLTHALRTDPARQNYKAALQELTQSHYKSLPTYQVTEINKNHGDQERFAAQAWFQEQLWGEGKGRSMKMAEQAAARAAYGKLKKALEDASAKTAKNGNP
ncbi:MAG: ribonuclease III [Cyanobacteria bacterium P01_D01_bin.36]